MGNRFFSPGWDFFRLVEVPFVIIERGVFPMCFSLQLPVLLVFRLILVEQLWKMIIDSVIPKNSQWLLMRSFEGLMFWHENHRNLLPAKQFLNLTAFGPWWQNLNFNPRIYPTKAIIKKPYFFKNICSESCPNYHWFLKSYVSVFNLW